MSIEEDMLTVLDEIRAAVVGGQVAALGIVTVFNSHEINMRWRVRPLDSAAVWALIAGLRLVEHNVLGSVVQVTPGVNDATPGVKVWMS
jgi:hypothetical protein